MLADLRKALCDDLRDGLKVQVHDTWPDRPGLPSVVVSAPTTGSYITAGQQFGLYVVHLEVLCLVPRQSAQASLAALDGLIEKVLANTVDWGLSRIDSPSAVPVGDRPALGCLIALEKGGRL